MSKPNPSKSPLIRVDLLVVKQGLADTREKAQALILAGQVLAGDHLYSKPGQKIPEDTELRVRGDVSPYVGRGALKLLKAVEEFKLNLDQKTCLDIGASTGGFTQVCLENGATKVYAVDVGHNQLHWKIRSDKKVVCFEGVNFRDIKRSELAIDPVDFVCIDVSFISLKLILPSVGQFLKPNGEVVSLVKPQHEVGKENVGKGGIVKDPSLHRQVIDDISNFSQSIGFKVKGLVESPIKGTTGNTEFLIFLQKR